MLEILGIVVALFVARLLWRAFQGGCNHYGVSEGAGAIKLLVIIVVTSVVGFVGLLILASVLSHANTGQW